MLMPAALCHAAALEKKFSSESQSTFAQLSKGEQAAALSSADKQVVATHLNHDVHELLLSGRQGATASSIIT